MDVGEFFEDLGTIAKDIVQGTVAVTSDVLNGAATVVGDVTNGVATVASKAIETVGTGVGGAVSAVNQATGSRIASGCRLAANGVQAAGTGVSGGLKMGVGIVTGVSNIVVGNEENADEIGFAASDALETSKETLGECSDKIVHELPALFMPPTRGIAATFLNEPVKPIPGSVVCCKLALLVDHSGIYIGGGRIIHRDGDYGLTCVDSETFLRRLNGNNPAITVYVSSKMDSLTKGRAVGSQSVADRAVKALNDPAHSNGYNLLTKNCHQFCQYCLTGRIDNGKADFTFSNLESVLRRCYEFDCWHVLDGCWKTSANDVFTEKACRNCSRVPCGRRTTASKNLAPSNLSNASQEPTRVYNVETSSFLSDKSSATTAMLVLAKAGRNEYEVKAWLMEEMRVSSSLATRLIQKRSVLKTSMLYEQAMQWKCELEALGATVELSKVSEGSRDIKFQSSVDAKVEMASNVGDDSKTAMFVLVRAGRNEYDVKEWLMHNMHVGFSMATQLVQKRSVLKTSMPYDKAMRWKRELEALGATVEVRWMRDVNGKMRILEVFL